MTVASPAHLRLGNWLEWGIQQWVRRTGRAVALADVPWLAGPTGARRIGADFYAAYARDASLDIAVNQPASGLLEDFNRLRSARFCPEQVAPAIRGFYERTVDYTLDVWSQWTGALWPFAGVLISLVSRNIEQLNLPLAPLATSRGMSSDIIRLVDRETGRARYAGWLRKAVAGNSIIYAGFYTTCRPPNGGGECVKVVFPLPGGSATVILRPENTRHGGFRLVSSGRRFGDPGYYRIHRVDDRTMRVKYVPIKEVIHVYQDSQGILRTDHTFRFWRLRFLTLHYKILPKQSLSWPTSTSFSVSSVPPW